jgi:DNA invertase Pin-like site-specific DNA recombinase
MSQMICYLRVSTSEQADSGLRLAAQRARLKSECSSRSWSDVVFIEDARLQRQVP